jgi:2-oxoisovalerate dehydrogenase E2 component (dihydrolipoyl transacylase)
MAFNIELPHVGESVTEAVIGKWLKTPGDTIEKYDPLVEVITDKVAMDVPSPATGTLTKILAEEGETVLMGAVIAEMDTAEEMVPSPTSAHAAISSTSASRIGTLVQGANVGPTGGAFLDTSLSTPEATDATTDVGDGNSSGSRTTAIRQKGLSPVVTRLAAEHGVDLNSLVGTGLGGRVSKKDVLTAVENRRGSALAASKRGATIESEDRIIELTPIRRMIADHMVKAVSEIPHAWSAIEVDVTGMVDWRTTNKERFESENGVRLTYLPIALSVVADALRTNPRLNSSWIDGKIVVKKAVNVGVAVAAADGLVVPVVHNADEGTVTELAGKLDGVVKRARSGMMTIEDVRGGTFTLNNTGALGSVWGNAIINHPQAAILTTEAIVKRPVVVSNNGNDEIVVRSMMNICLSFDHRIIDGDEASEFLQAVKTGIEAIHLESNIK